MYKKVILAIANVLYMLVVTKSYKKSYVHQDLWILANFSYLTIACGDNQFFCCKFWLIVTPACSISIIREELGQGGVYEGYKRGEKFGGKGSRLWFFLKSLVQYYILREIAAMVG